MAKLNRRDFLKATAMTAVGVVAASCAQPTPQVIEKEVPVEQVRKETVVVEKEVAVEKVVTATPVTSKYQEAPSLAGMVRRGELPPVDERVGDEPMITEPVEEIGQYGGTWHRLASSVGDIRMPDRLAYDSLVRYTHYGADIVPSVAKSWEVDPGGKEFTFSLRKGMKWSDGEPFTSADLMFYMEDHLGNEEISPGFPSTWSPGGEPMTAEAPDDYTIRFVTEVPFGLFMSLLPSASGRFFTLYPKHYLQQFHAKYTDKAKLEAAAKEAGFEAWYQYYGAMGGNVGAATKNFPEFPVIHAWKVTVPPPKQPVVFERNPYYWRVDTEGNQLPYIDRMEHMIVQTADDINLRALSGEIDMQMRSILFDNYPLYQENKEKGDYRILLWDPTRISDNVIFPHVTNKDPVLREIVADKRFRYALSLGMNRQEIIDGVYLGMEEPTQISPLPTSPHYWEEQAKHMTEYDPEQANAYLDEMGLTERDSAGYRLRPDGERLTLVFEYTPLFGSWASVIELLAAHWKELGIEIIPKDEARALLTERTQAGEHDLSIWPASVGFNPLIDPGSFMPYHAGPSSISAAYARWYHSNGEEGEEPTEDIRRCFELYDEIKVTVDEEEQQALFREILELNKENLWALPVCTHPPQLVICKNNFRNVPEQAGYGWHVLTPGNTAPEQYFIRQD